MAVLVYTVSVLLFCVVALLLPIALAPVVWAFKSITGQHVLNPAGVYLVLSACASVILLAAAEAAWRTLGYTMGWLFLAMIVIVHIVMGSAREGNLANRTQAIGVVIGVVCYGVGLIGC